MCVVFVASWSLLLQEEVFIASWSLLLQEEVFIASWSSLLQEESVSMDYIRQQKYPSLRSIKVNPFRGRKRQASTSAVPPRLTDCKICPLHYFIYWLKDEIRQLLSKPRFQPMARSLLLRGLNCLLCPFITV